LQLSHCHRKIDRHTVYSIVSTFFLFIILLCLRVNRIYYAFLEFEFKLNSISHIVFLVLTMLQDFFFVFLCYFLARGLLGKTRKTRSIILSSMAVSTIFLFIVLYNIIDLIYYKTSGFSISWNVILQSDHVMNLTDSAAVYMTPFLITLSVTAVAALTAGAFYLTRLIMKFQDKNRFVSILVPRRVLVVIIVVMLFFRITNVPRQF
jgi:hypothetical protein